MSENKVSYYLIRNQLHSSDERIDNKALLGLLDYLLSKQICDTHNLCLVVISEFKRDFLSAGGRRP